MTPEEVQKLLDMQERLTGLADKRIESMWSAHKAIVYTVGTVLAVGLTLATILISRNVTELRNSVEREQRQLQQQLEATKIAFQNQAEEQLAQFRADMELELLAQSSALKASLTRQAAEQIESLRQDVEAAINAGILEPLLP